MSRKLPNKIIINAARDGESGELYVIDERKGLHLVSANTTKALIRKLRPIIRAEYADDPEMEIEVKVVGDPGTRWPAPGGIYSGG